MKTFSLLHLLTYTVLKGLNPIVSILIAIILPVVVGISEYGVYTILYAVVMGVVTFSKYGVSTSYIRWGSIDLAELGREGLDQRILGLLSTVIISTFFFSCIGVGLFLHDSMTMSSLFIVSMLSMIFVILSVVSIYLKLTGQILLSSIFEYSGPLLLGLAVFLLAFYFYEIDVIYFLYSLFFSAIFFFLVAFFLLNFECDWHGLFDLSSMKLVFRDGWLYYYFIDISNFIFQYGVIIYSAYLFSYAEVGSFSASMRASMVLSFIPLVFNGYFAPRFANYSAKNKIIMFKREFFLACKLAIAVSVLVCFTLFAIASIFYEELAGVYKIDFRVLSILVIGQLINVVTGPSGSVLNMSGNQNKVVKSISIGLLISSGGFLYCYLSPSLLALAFSVAIFIITKNAYCFYSALCFFRSNMRG